MATELRLSSLSREYIRVQVSAKDSGLPVNPTGDVVQMAFTKSYRPQPGDWKVAVWETDTTVTPNAYFARCLVGPGATAVLTAGTYQVWVKVQDNPEVPVRLVGTLVVE